MAADAEDLVARFSRLNAFAQDWHDLVQRIREARLSEEGIELSPDDVKTLTTALRSMVKHRQTDVDG